MLDDTMPLLRHMFCFFLLTLALACALPETASAAPKDLPPPQTEPWRIRFLEAAVVQGDRVLLGEVAVPLGDMPPATWQELSRRELWPAPSEGGKPMNMTRPRLQEAVVQTMNDLAPYCLFPGSMVLQRGGILIGKVPIQHMVESELAPYLAGLPGEAVLRDFRLPQQVFLAHAGQELVLEPPRKVAPGRLSLRLLTREMDGTVQQKLTGSVFVDCWAEVPCATAIMNKDDLLDHNKITFKRMNLASLRGTPWDGRGGPWQLVRPITLDQVIYQSDVAHIPTVRKGSMVTLLYEGKTVRLTVQAEAMTDGSAGESIPVRNRQSKREVYGVVRDSGTVIVSTMP